MLVYRVFPYLATAERGQPGHPLYEHRPQVQGRIDHPDYFVWYLTPQPEAAAGEVFGDLSTWEEDMFLFPKVAGSRRALGVYRLPNDLRVLDLDDPAQLVKRSLRPTQVITRNRSVSQEWGSDVWNERNPHDTSARRWQAIKWWSYQRPQWEIIGSWLRPTLVRVDPLNLDHAAVREAAEAPFAGGCRTRDWSSLCGGAPFTSAGVGSRRRKDQARPRGGDWATAPSRWCLGAVPPSEALRTSR